MSNTSLPIGTEIAAFLRPSAGEQHFRPISTPLVPKTIGDLLIILSDQPPPFFGFIKTTCTHLCTYLNKASDELSLEMVATHKSGFRDYLAKGRYAENSIRQYLYQTYVLLKLAKKHGGDPDRSISAEWKKLLATAGKAQVLEITKYFSRVTKTPNEITIDALNS